MQRPRRLCEAHFLRLLPIAQNSRRVHQSTLATTPAVASSESTLRIRRLASRGDDHNATSKWDKEAQRRRLVREVARNAFKKHIEASNHGNDQSNMAQSGSSAEFKELKQALGDPQVSSEPNFFPLSNTAMERTFVWDKKMLWNDFRWRSDSTARHYDKDYHKYQAKLRRRFGLPARQHNLKQLEYLVHDTAPELRREAVKRFKSWIRDFWEFSTEVKGPWRVESGNSVGKSAMLRLLDSEDADEMRKVWKQLPHKKRRALWPEIILCTLRSNSRKADTVLRATFEVGVTPSFAIRDVMSFLVEHSTWLPEQECQDVKQNLRELFMFMLKNSRVRYLQLPQWLLYELLLNAPTADVARFYRALVRHEHLIHQNTALQFAHRIAKDDAYKDTAIEILQALVKADHLDINSERGLALCTRILSVKADRPEEELQKPMGELFETLLNLGLHPNLITYTVLIRNLCLADNLAAALEVFDSMNDRPIEPDVHLYSILLNGAKLCQNYSVMEGFARAAQAAGMRDVVLWTDFLHGIFLPWLLEARRKRLASSRPVPAFHFMLKAYAKYFELGPLQTIMSPEVVNRVDHDTTGWEARNKVLPLIQNVPAFDSSQLLKPGGETLRIMVLGHIFDFSMPSQLVEFYARFRQLLQSGDPTAIQLMRDGGSLIFDIILKRAMAWEGLLDWTVEIVKHMLEASLAADSTATSPAVHVERSQNIGSDVQNNLLSLPKGCPPPSVFTWSILLDGFRYYERMDEAEHILQMMRENGVQPNRVTWNSLVSGYAWTQNIRDTVDATMRGVAAGFEPDQYTLDAISKLKDRELALLRVEKLMSLRRELEEKLANSADGSRASEDQLKSKPAQSELEQHSETELAPEEWSDEEDEASELYDIRQAIRRRRIQDVRDG